MTDMTGHVGKVGGLPNLRGVGNVAKNEDQQI